MLVVTGKNLKLVTPRDTITARDSLEWYDQKQFGVARGDARRGARRPARARRRADRAGGASEPERPVAASAASTPTAMCSSRRRDQIARGDAGVYNLDTGIATLIGHVRLTRGDNELRGRYAVVDLNTNVSRLLSAPPGAKVAGARPRVEGLLVPRRKPDAAQPDARPTAEEPTTRRQPRTAAARRAGAAAGRRQSRPRRHQSRQELQAAGRCCATSTSRCSAARRSGCSGPNGAGKTTCFYIITGLIAPDVGTITLDGDDITELPMYRRARLGIGYLPQEASIFRGLTVEQNIRAVLEVVGARAASAREAMLDALLAEFSITHLRRAPALALSGGERRRVEIARALATQPHFILLDEPLAGIDPIAVGDIRDLVAHLKDRGIGVLITDHNVRETLDIVDRAYILHEGQVLMEGAPGRDRRRRRRAPRLSGRALQPAEPPRL